MPRTTIPIYADGDFERLAELRQRVGVAQRQALAAKAEPRRFGDADTSDAAITEAEAAYDAFVDQAAERAEEWIVESIGHEEWRALLLAHPPRKVTQGEDAKQADHPDDAEWGFNTETFGKALLLWVDPEDGEHRTVQKAGDIDLSGLARRVKRLSAGQFETLWATAYGLNMGGIRDPKLARFSLGDPRSDET